MAQEVLVDAYVEVDGDPIPDGVLTNVALSYEAEAADVSGMGVDTRKHLGGPKTWALALEAHSDETSMGSYFDLVGETVQIEVRAKSDERSEENPGYTGLALITEYSPIEGAYGDTRSISMNAVSAGPLTRETAPEGV